MPEAARALLIPAVSSTGMAKVSSRLSHNLNGQRLGRKGRITRDRLIAAAGELVAAGGDQAITLSAVARHASLGMTAIYSYFADLTEVLVAALEPVMAEGEETFLRQAREFWPDDSLGERCLEFVETFHRFWQSNMRLLRLRNSLADQDDQRLMELRVREAQPLIGAFIRQMGHDPRDTNSPATGMATVLFTGIERIMALATDPGLAKVLPGRLIPDVEHFLRAEARLLELGIREHRTTGTLVGFSSAPG